MESQSSSSSSAEHEILLPLQSQIATTARRRRRVVTQQQRAISSSSSSTNPNPNPNPTHESTPITTKDPNPHLVSPILTILSESGFNSSTPSSIDSLSQHLDDFLTSIATISANLSSASGRNNVNARDLLGSFVAMGVIGNKYSKNSQSNQPEEDEEDQEEREGEIKMEEERDQEQEQEEIWLEDLKDFVHKSKIRDHLLQSQPDSFGYRNRFGVCPSHSHSLTHEEIEEEGDQTEGQHSRFYKESFLSSDIDDEEDQDEEEEDKKEEDRIDELKEGWDQFFSGKSHYDDHHDSNSNSNSNHDQEEKDSKRRELRIKRKKMRERFSIGVGLEGEISRKKRRRKIDKSGGIDEVMMDLNSTERRKEKVDDDDWEEVMEIGGLLSHLPDLPPRHTWVRTEAYAPRISASSTSISLRHLDLKLQASRLTSISLRGLIRKMEVAESSSRNFKRLKFQGVQEGSGESDGMSTSGNGNESIGNERGIESGKLSEVKEEIDSDDRVNNSISSSTVNSNSAINSGSIGEPLNSNGIQTISSSTPSTPLPTTSTSTSNPITTTTKPKTLLRLRMPSSSSSSNASSGVSTPQQQQQVPLTSVPRSLLSETNPSSSGRRFSVGNNLNPNSPIGGTGVGQLNNNGSSSTGLSTPIRRSTFTNLNLSINNFNLNSNSDSSTTIPDSPMTPWTSFPGQGQGGGSGSGSFGRIPQTPSFNYPNTPIGMGMNGNLFSNLDSELSNDGNDGRRNLLNEGGIHQNHLDLPGTVNFKKDWYSIVEEKEKKPSRIKGNGKGKGEGKRKGKKNSNSSGDLEKDGKKRRWLI